MRIRLPRRLLAVWLALLALLVVIALVEYDDAPQEAADEKLLLPAPVSELGALELAHAGALHRFERDAGGTWFYHGRHAASEPAHAHQPDPAAAQRLADAFAALGRTRIERRLPYERDAKQYGLAVPQTVLLLYRKGEPRPFVQYEIGDVAPDTFSRYVHRTGSAEVVTIPDYQVQNLLALIRGF